MSAIVALLAYGEPPGREPLERALRAAPHRGTELSVIVHGNVALGLARRDDADEGGIVVDRELAIAVTGVVDNWTEIRNTLGASAGAADCANGKDGVEATILDAFRTLGPESAASRMRGMYTVAVTDGHRLWCFRDHLGAGTLFTRDDANGFWAASEAKQIIAGAGIVREPDLAVLEGLFYGEEDDSTPTCLRGIGRLPKATLLQVDSARSRATPYWDPERHLETARIATSDLKDRFDELMTRAVNRVLRGDDLIALSGGIDSPTVAAFASRAYRDRFGEPLPAMSMVFPDYPSCDEQRYIEELARHLQMPVTTYQPPLAGQALRPLADWVKLADGPWSGAWAPGMDEDRYARMRSMNRATLLTGDFAELVMDFSRHLVVHLLARGRIRAATRQLAAQRRRGQSAGGVLRQIAGVIVPSSVLRMYRHYNPRFPTPAWVDRGRVVRGKTNDLVHPRGRWRRQQLAGFIGPGIAMEAYQIHQDAAGIRVRRPWGDIDLWEFFLSLPAETKFPGPQHKQLVRGLMRDRLPHSILDRTDKTVLDEFVRAGIDYQSLDRWLEKPKFAMPGVDHKLMRGRLAQRDMGLFEYLWAKDLAGVQAFLDSW